MDTIKWHETFTKEEQALVKNVPPMAINKMLFLEIRRNNIILCKMHGTPYKNLFPEVVLIRKDEIAKEEAEKAKEVNDGPKPKHHPDAL